MNNPRTATTSNSLRHHGAYAAGEKGFLPPPVTVSIFNYTYTSAPAEGAATASACPERSIPTGQALVVYSYYRAPEVEVVEVACEAGYAASVDPDVGGWDDEVDLGGGEMN